MESFLIVVWGSAVVWAAYSFVCLIYPIGIIKTRRSAELSFVVCSILFVLVPVIYLVFILRSDSNSDSGSPDQAEVVENETPSGQSAISEAIQLKNSSAIPDSCGDGGLMLNDIVAVTGSHDLHELPDLNASKTKNDGASNLWGRTIYYHINNSMTVRRVCAQKDWTEVRIVTPDTLTHLHGWVRNTSLREIQYNATGDRIFVEEDFHWDDDTAEFKPQIVAVVNRIARENKNCDPIDRSSVTKSPSRGTPDDPVFFVTCGRGGNVFNVWFRPADADLGTQFVAREPIEQSIAADACESAAKEAATHPSTVSFSHILDLSYIPYASGRARIVSSFTAKNAFDLELKYRIDCLFDGAELIDVTIASHH